MKNFCRNFLDDHYYFNKLGKNYSDFDKDLLTEIINDKIKQKTIEFNKLEKDYDHLIAVYSELRIQTEKLANLNVIMFSYIKELKFFSKRLKSFCFDFIIILFEK